MSRGLTGWHPKRALELTHLLCDGVDSAVPLATAPEFSVDHACHFQCGRIAGASYLPGGVQLPKLCGLEIQADPV